MRRSLAGLFLASALVLTPACATAPDEPVDAPASAAALRAAIDAPRRSAENRARDVHRHPYETLTFFGVEADDNVVEVWPGGGWYSEILAPYLAGQGSLALVGTDSGLKRARDKAAAEPGAYATVLFAPIDKPGDPMNIDDGSADVVLTFRNVHNWLAAKPPYAAEMFQMMARLLKPGGTLGVVEHRLPEEADAARELTSGYVKVSTVRRLAEQAGLKLVASSEINANPKDTKDYPEGVWTLPPSLRLKDIDRAKYLAIGESDRMTLKFVKPK